MKTNEGRRRKRRIFLLAAVLASISTLIPAAAIGAPAQGDEASIEYRTILTGSDGENFYLTGLENSIGYRKDGSIYYFEHENYSGPRMHYRIEVPGEGAWWGYCIEHGVSLPDAQNYEGMNSDNDRYLLNLPETARNGILLTSLYGRQPGRAVPVAGCNDDDWYWATQVILWEYQQLLRTGPDDLKTNGLVPAGFFRKTLAGRPAEKCYDYILDRIRGHERIPSFTARESSDYPAYLLTRTGNQGEYTLRLTDQNHTGVVLDPGAAAVGISYRGNGEYAFSSNAPGKETLLNFKKLVPMPSHDLLVWGSGTSHQALITGTRDPFSFGMIVRTPGQGLLTVRKTSEDGIVRGIGFRLTGPDQEVIEGVTDERGEWRVALDPGRYLLEENRIPGYLPFEPKAIEITENSTVLLNAVNQLDRRPFLLVKTDAETGKPVLLEGALFRIDGKIYATDKNGTIAIPEGLPFGTYEIEEIRSPKGYASARSTVTVTIGEDTGEAVSLNFQNSPQKGRVRVHKTGPIPESPDVMQHLEGAVLELRALEDIRTPDGTLRLAKGEKGSTIVTGPDGTGLSGLLYPGKYRIIETKSPMGYKLPDKPLGVVLVPADQSGRAVLTVEIALTNEPEETPPATGDGRPNPIYPLMGLCLSLPFLIWAVQAQKGNHTLR